MLLEALYMNSKPVIIIDNLAICKIMDFYKNTGLKFSDTNTGDVIEKYINDTINSIATINHNSLLQQPYLNSWQEYKRITLGKWNFAVEVKDNTIIIVDACHRQNLTNNPEIHDDGQLPYHNPRITGIHFPTRLPGGSCFIRADIDGEWHGIRKISQEDYDRGRLHPEYAIHLAERAYAKELAQERFPLEVFLNKGRKP